MCSRFYLTHDPGVIARRFGASPAQGGGRRTRYNPTSHGAPATPSGGTATLVEATPGQVTFDTGVAGKNGSMLLDSDAMKRFNIAPTQMIVVVTDEGGRQQVEAVWGLIPP